MNPDFLDIIRALLDAEARFSIVGAYAVNLYVDPRATGDLDIWIEPTPDNASRVIRALKDFGAPLTGISDEDFASPGITLQIGIPPRRIDILTQISGIEFVEAWTDHCEFAFGPFTVPFLSKAAVIKNKRAAYRPKDISDLDSLEKP